jgi:hypothetical protein
MKHTHSIHALFMTICMVCAISGASTSRLYPPSEGETGGLRLVEVIGLASRDEILKLGKQLDHLHASGLKDSDFKDGSVSMARIYCCSLPPHSWNTTLNSTGPSRTAGRGSF